MNLPEWVDPTSPDDPRAAAAAPGPEGDGLPLGVEDPELADKPVLEWTKDDWARWVLGGTPAADAEAADADAEPVVGAGPRAGPAAPVEVDDDGPHQPIVDIRLPEEDDLVVPAAPVPGGDEGWDPPEPAADLGAAEGEFGAGAGGQPDEDRPWDDETEFERRADLWAGQGAATGPGSGDEPEDEPWAGPPGDRWSGARSAATALDPDTLAVPVPSPEEAMAALAPASAAWPAGIADPPGDRPPVAAAPAWRAGGGWSRLEAAPVEDSRSRRVRSLIGLLCLAVTMGVLIAALITVTIVALSLALRRAVG